MSARLVVYGADGHREKTAAAVGLLFLNKERLLHVDDDINNNNDNNILCFPSRRDHKISTPRVWSRVFNRQNYQKKLQKSLD